MENYCREKLMLFTHWRNEDTDLYGGFTTFEEHYNHIKLSLTEQLQVYEPFIDATDHAENSSTLNTAEQHWDLLAPSIQQPEIDAENEGPTDANEFLSVNPEIHNYTVAYDIGVDMGLAGSTALESNVHRYDMPDHDYFQLMHSLNNEQKQFLYDTIHLLKTSDAMSYEP
jgi:hypothetical protein